MLRAEAEKEVEEARRLGHMNLTKELDGLQKFYHSEDGGPHDVCFWHKMEIWREMVRRIEALESAACGIDDMLAGLPADVRLELVRQIEALETAAAEHSTAIHELLHAENWAETEEVVDRVSSEIGKVLWRAGYRRSEK